MEYVEADPSTTRSTDARCKPPCKRDPEVIEIRQGLLLQYVVVRELCGVCKSVKSV